MEKSNLSESVLARVTPGGGNYGAGVVLTERQRVLARSAGMSYRDYYDLISGIPEHTRKNNRSQKGDLYNTGRYLYMVKRYVSPRQKEL